MEKILLNECVDGGSFREEFEATGRIRINNILRPAGADEIYRCLVNDVPWDLAYMDDVNAITMSRHQLARLSPQQQQAIQKKVIQQAGEKFQFMYGHYSLIHAYNEGITTSNTLNDIVEFLNSSHFLDFARTVTGCMDVVKADVQASCYSHGHFLGLHNDFDTQTTRRVAFVLGFSRNWKADWGGLTLFYDDGGNVTGAFVPAFNSLTMFRVPVYHSVTYVTPFAREVRYSITGWLLA